jgi:hypothetical protein
MVIGISGSSIDPNTLPRHTRFSPIDPLDILDLPSRSRFSNCINLRRVLSSSMSISAPCAAARCCRLATRSPVASSTRCLRLTSSTPFNRRRKHPRRWQSTDAAATNPKISGIVDQISQLTLLETADLVASLKVRGL